jgi:hypothetical protein
MLQTNLKEAEAYSIEIRSYEQWQTGKWIKAIIEIKRSKKKKNNNKNTNSSMFSDNGVSIR